jgi:hypothetical protein
MSFKRLDQEDVVISSETVTGPVWTNNTTILTTFFTSSVQANSTPGSFYLDIYQTGSILDEAQVQFSIAYADKNGSGSVLFNAGVPSASPTSVNYGTYRSLILADEEANFTFGSVTSPYFYVISFERSRFKEKLLPGTFELRLVTGTGNIVLSDTSADVTSLTFTDAGRVYELKGLMSGSTTPITTGSPLFNASGSYGKIFPDIGVIILNGQALDAPSAAGGLELGTERNSNNDDRNARKLYNAIAAGGAFKMNSEETVSSNFVFVRARNSEFNYSTNPSYITGSGEVRVPLLINDPRSYITSVGLYNDNNDLLAVAKLSRPLLKDSRKEALVRIKLDF